MLELFQAACGTDFDLLITIIGTSSYHYDVFDTFSLCKYIVIRSISEIPEVIAVIQNGLETWELKYRSENLTGKPVDFTYRLKFAKLERRSGMGLGPKKGGAGTPLLGSGSSKRGLTTLTYFQDVQNDFTPEVTVIDQYLRIPNLIHIEEWGTAWYSEGEFWYTDKTKVRCRCTVEGQTKTFSFGPNATPIVVVDEETGIPGQFIRTYENKQWLIKWGVIIRYVTTTKGHFLSSLKKKSVLKTNLIYVLDIECVNIAGAFRPYAVGVYNGREFMYFYGVDCIVSALNYLVSLNKSFNVYVHNLDRFDSLYLVHQIIELSLMVTFVPGAGQQKDSMTSFTINVTTGKKIHEITFIDSYKILPSSLDKLSKSFNLSSSKQLFPYTFMDSYEKLTYVGPKPAQTHYPKIMTDEQYNAIQSPWNAEDATRIYLKQDCVLLYEILIYFGNQLVERYNVNFLTKQTLPSQTMAIFRIHFLTADIQNLNKTVDAAIRQSYFGGIVDVYKPILINGYHYDVNSQYPQSMTKDMPVGPARYVKGTIDQENFFGFVLVRVTAPSNMDIPFLVVRDGKRVLSPLGTWVGWYFSEELKYAQTLGYKVEVLYRGYEFDRNKEVFSKFVEHFYNIKRDATDPVQRMIAKQILNSQYGRFGMSQTSTEIRILTNERAKTILIEEPQTEQEAILSPDAFKNGDRALYRIERAQEERLERFANIAIASAVTAYSRIEIDKYKRIDGNQCYYTDTDSVFLSEPLPPEMVNIELGGMKLEDKVIKGVFVSSKVYGYQPPVGKPIVKIKGFKSDSVSLKELESQLTEGATLEQDSQQFRAKKVYVEQQTRTKTQTNTIRNKRDPIIENGVVVDTKPKVYVDKWSETGAIAPNQNLGVQHPNQDLNQDLDEDED